MLGFARLLLAIVLAFASHPAQADELREDDSATSEHAPANEPELDREQAAAFQGIADEVTADALENRPDGAELVPSLTADQLRELVHIARAKVLARMQAKMEKKAGARMATIGAMISWFSLAGLLLLAMPLVLRRKYPDARGLLKYSGLAALTFIITVNLFGVVVLGFRSAQSGLGTSTNPQLRIASAFFDAIDKNADDLIVFGKELFGPTLEKLAGPTTADAEPAGEEQPASILLENGKKLIGDARVFLRIRAIFKQLDVVFGILPSLLLLVTMVLFVVAIKPTLLEIVQLPMEAARGRASGKQVVKRALRRVGGELLATLCTLGVLVVLTIVSGAILARVVGPALDALIQYFTLAVMYLKFVSGAKSGLVFLMLFSVLFFLALNLVAVIAAMALFLGKAQKIFQRKFTGGVAMRKHARFWKWGSLSLLAALIVPWVYLVAARWLIENINDKLTANVTDASSIPWTPIMLFGPLFLVVGLVGVFWAARGFNALAFLATYKVPPPSVASRAPTPMRAAAA